MSTGGATFVGRVVSNRMQKTVVVAVDRLVWVPKLKVFERRTSRHLAHCELGEGLPAAGAAPAATPTTTAAATPPPSSTTSPDNNTPRPLHIGDVVRIAWTPRASRRKSYRVERVLRRARVYSPTLGETALQEYQARRAAEEAALAAAGAGVGADGAAATLTPPRVARAEAALEAARRRLAQLREAHDAAAAAKAGAARM
jgi:ribosomal protein S17